MGNTCKTLAVKKKFFRIVDMPAVQNEKEESVQGTEDGEDWVSPSN